MINEATKILNEHFFDDDGDVNSKVISLKIHELLHMHYGTKHFSYVGLNFCSDLDVRKFMITNWGEAAEIMYRDNGIVDQSPFTQKAMKSILPFAWRDVTKFNRRELELLKRAQKFGMSANSSFIIPVHGLMGETGIFVSDFDYDRFEYDTNIQRIMYEMQPIAFMMHEKMVKFSEKEKTPDVKLTPRQIEVLKWASKGNSCDEIGVIMKLSPNTVRNHLNLARAALGASNTTHACSIAVKNRIWLS